MDMNELFSRRRLIEKSGILTVGSLLFSNFGLTNKIIDMIKNTSILKIKQLSLPWETQDPFIFCSYHYDEFPGGNDNLGPNSSLEGRNIGQDFANIDGWNMYHGTTVPGFPAHPHSGFETITVVTKGMVDHSDSLGAIGRFGNGDVQWLTSGKGVQHAEMFPLLNKDSNPFEIFQLWLNLPQKSKKANPHYKMLWNEDIPLITEKDEFGNLIHIKLVAGVFNGQIALSPTPDSWAADPNNHVQVWTMKMDAEARFVIPAIDEDVTRTLYFYQGDSCEIANEKIGKNHLIELDPKKEIQIDNGADEGYFLFLQGRPIKEPIVQYGPFVANTKLDLQETMQKYQRTQFGGWPWSVSDPVHGKSKGRFSKVAGKEEIIR